MRSLLVEEGYNPGDRKSILRLREVVEVVLERLQKILARAGYGSRRACEDLIRAGRVQVNGKVAVLGEKADPGRDLITVDGERVLIKEKYVYVLLNKPKGYVSTVNDPQGRPKVTDLVKVPGVRLFPVGRLDLNTSGLLLLTNDGEFAYLMTHPKHGIWKTYQVLVQGKPTRATIERLRKGVPLPEGRTAPAKVRLLKAFDDQAVLEISIREGKKRQVRRMCQFVGHSVLDLKRTKFAFLTLGDLRPGQFRYLTSEEVAKLKEMARKE
jgi:pseudouridine synthase